MFIHPLLRLLVTEPQLLADHVEAYAVLVDEEIANVVSIWKRRVVLNVIAFGLLAVGLTLGGVALMFWAVLPTPDIRSSWTLILVPSIPMAIALVCLLACRREMPRAFPDTKQQLAADLMMLREVGAAGQGRRS